MGVHAVQIAHEKRRFIAAGAGADFHDRVAGIRGVGRHEAELHLFFETRNFLFQSRDFLRCHLCHLGIVPGCQDTVFLQLALRFEQAFAERHEVLEPCVFATQFLSAAVVLKHLGIAQLGFHLAHAGGEFLDVRLEIHGRKKKPPAAASTGRAVTKENGYFLALAARASAIALALAARCWNLSTRPAVSTKVC